MATASKIASVPATGARPGWATAAASPRIPRASRLGDIDELNPCIGPLLAEKCPRTSGTALLQIQHDLLIWRRSVHPRPQHDCEAQVQRLDAARGAQWQFARAQGIHPAGRYARQPPLRTRAHFVCRRAERSLVAPRPRRNR
jgi:cob(I)alamin adenosyltransferase